MVALASTYLGLNQMDGTVVGEGLDLLHCPACRRDAAFGRSPGGPGVLAVSLVWPGESVGATPESGEIFQQSGHEIGGHFRAAVSGAFSGGWWVKRGVTMKRLRVPVGTSGCTHWFEISGENLKLFALVVPSHWRKAFSVCESGQLSP